MRELLPSTARAASAMKARPPVRAEEARPPVRAEEARPPVRAGLTAAVVALLGGTLGLGCAASGPSTRSLHYMDDTLVYSAPVHHQAYAAYLRARVALEAEPADLATAERELQRALHVEPRDPHLWTSLAEVELRRGDRDAALAAGRVALSLRPDYPPALQLVAKLEGNPAGATAMSRHPRGR